MRALALFGLFLAASAAQEPPATSPAATSPAETKPYRIGGGVTAPSVIYKVEPEYSEEARQARFEGTVIVYVVVDETGNPRGLKVIRPLGLGLDEKAIEAVQQWKFKPGMKAGRPVAVQATIEVNFRLYRGWRIVSISFETPDGVSRPVLTRQKLPPVPTGGRASVTLSFDVDERGNPTHFRVKESSDEKLEGELLAAVRDWVFTPGAKNGKAVLVPCVAKFVLDETVSPAGPRAAAEAAPSKTVDPAKMAAIEEMFAVTKVDQMIRQVLSQIETAMAGQIDKSMNDLIGPESDNRSKLQADLQEFEKQIFALVADRIDFQKLKPDLIKIYDETLTTEEITAAIAFYKSPAGSAILQKLPSITAKSVLLGQQAMRDIMPELQKMTIAWQESMKKKYGEAVGK